jgi:signal transduction histidine kinase
MRRFRNAPLGRAAIGVSLGALVFVLHRIGAFSGADFAVLDVMGKLAPPPSADHSLVLLVSPGDAPSPDVQSASTDVKGAALRNALAAGAVAVGMEESFLIGAESSVEFRRAAADPKCVVLSADPSRASRVGRAGGLARVQTAALEPIVYEHGVARRVKATIPRTRGDGFIVRVVSRAAQSTRRSPAQRQALADNLDRLASPRGLIVDYSLPESAVSRIRLGALAEGPIVALRPLVAGRVVLISSLPGQDPQSAPDLALSRQPSRRRVDSTPVVAWAIATVLAGPGVRELPPELYGSALVLLAVILMLVLSDRGLRGKVVGSLVALLGAAGAVVVAWVCMRYALPPLPVVVTALVVFVVTACLELSEAGQMIDRELQTRVHVPTSTGDEEETSPRAQVERVLQSIVQWHELPAAGLVLGAGGYSRRVATVLGNAPGRWSRAPSLHSLGVGAIRANAPLLGTWPSGAAKEGHWHALAVPVVGWAGQSVALILARPQLPIPHEAVDFGARAVRQLLAGRPPGTKITTSPLAAAEIESALPLPTRVEYLRSARMGRQRQAAVAAAWRSSVHEAVILFDMAGNPVLWNRRAEMLFSPDGEDLAHFHFVPLLAEASGLTIEEARQAATDVLIHGTPFICDIEDPSGRYNYVATVTQVAIEGDAPGGLAIRCIDVTGVCRPARVEARLMSVAAHEMRTPLTSILGYSELLLDKTDRGSIARRYAAAIHRQAGRVESIVSELLAVTRLEAGREELVIEPVDAMMLARSVANAMEPLARDHGVTLAVQGEEDEAQIRGDVRKLERVVENLVANAIKYSPPGATVTVDVQRTGDRAVLSVSDTGYGIAEKDVPHVFEKFYRAKNQHTQAVAGTGLGLAIVKLIVEAHGGEVTLRSAVGQGSTFTVRLPISEPHSTQAPSSVA